MASHPRTLCKRPSGPCGSNRSTAAHPSVSSAWDSTRMRGYCRQSSSSSRAGKNLLSTRCQLARSTSTCCPDSPSPGRLAPTHCICPEGVAAAARKMRKATRRRARPCRGHRLEEVSTSAASSVRKRSARSLQTLAGDHHRPASPSDAFAQVSRAFRDGPSRTSNSRNRSGYFPWYY